MIKRSRTCELDCYKLSHITLVAEEKVMATSDAAWDESRKWSITQQQEDKQGPQEPAANRPCSGFLNHSFPY